ncbi:MAG: ABC transporter permease subunit [Dongiaceae bacterium]
MTDAAIPNVAAMPQPLSPRREVWLAMRGNPGAMAGLSVIILLIFSAVFADVISPNSPIEQFRDYFRRPPAWSEDGSWQFPLGTDDLGRCLLSRIIYGTRISLLIGCIVVTLSLALGLGFGLIAGFFRGLPDIGLMRFMDVLLAMPSLLLSIVIVAILGPSLINAMIAVAITYVPHYARLMRASVLTELSKDYVTASRVAGAGTMRLMWNTVLPNCMAPIIVQATLSFSTAILDAAALGFLGLGARAPTPEWGTMLADAVKFLRAAPWIVTFPGLAILITVLAFNLMGDGLRDALDPKLKR